MTELRELDEHSFYEFVAQPGPGVLFAFVHPLQPLNAALPQHLPEAFDGLEVPMASLSLTELVIARSPVLALLQQATQDSPVARRFGVLPGYYLTCEGRVVAWQSGLPAGPERSLLLGGAIFGAVWHVKTGQGALVARLLQSVFDEASAKRIAGSFARAFAHRGERESGTRSAPRATPDDLRWAYRLLGLTPSASERDVERAWRKKRAESHPDLAYGDPSELERRTRLSLELDRARELIRAHHAERADSRGR